MKHLLCSLPLLVALCGCTSDKRLLKREKGPHGTVAYLVTVDATIPCRIEADGDNVGTTPLTLKIFGDKDGSFHNFGRQQYIVRAIPQEDGWSGWLGR